MQWSFEQQIETNIGFFIMFNKWKRFCIAKTILNFTAFFITALWVYFLELSLGFEWDVKKMRHFTSFTYRYKYSIRNESFNCYNVVFRDALNLTDILYSSTLILHFNRKYLGYEINIYLANAYFCINSFICILILLM